jgi:hypothetical protein
MTLIYILERHQIEGRDASQIPDELKSFFDQTRISHDNKPNPRDDCN